MGLWAPCLLHKEQKRNRVQVVVTSDMLIYYHFVNTFNSLRPSGTIWWQGYGSSLVWVIIGSGNGLLPDSTKPLPVPVLTNYHWGFTESCRGQPHRNSLTDLSLKIFDSRLKPHLPGAKWVKHYTMPILGLRPANERRHYRVTPSPTGRAQTQNQPWLHDNRW